MDRNIFKDVVDWKDLFKDFKTKTTYGAFVNMYVSVTVSATSPCTAATPVPPYFYSFR